VSAAGGALALAADPAVVERAADPGEFILQACERAKAWLREALEHGEIEQIAELKSRAEAIRVYTTQKQLGKDAELAAAEIVRRAERGIGEAIRRGQQAGEVRSRGQSRVTRQPGNNRLVASPTDFATEDELTGNGAGIYHLTDGVGAGDFEDALDQAKAEGNLSRANLVRKIRQRRRPQPAEPGGQAPDPADRSPAAAARRRELISDWAGRGMTSGQIGDRLQISDQRVRQVARDHGITIRADVVIGRSRRLDSNRIVRHTADALEGLVMSIRLADPQELDQAQAAGWAASISASARALSRFAKEVIREAPE